ncbi:hypothetical protein RE628_11535 [Paenibacillus sp. D2_2]|uniref:hypothetical protein n=1 Tax=Paenibacillus sp. D2_2 TaxID=3073092 RepID=UPI0028154894|nr:hypothetical protein [Paenibacillus sp. D2_2]WMT42857.1 hypothetical protein RE628_11535 [Paenibacillus sp. D2_2]
MAQIKAILKCELDPFNPVPEICQVIDAMIANNKLYEESILLGVIESIQGRLGSLEQQKKGVGTRGVE